MSYLQKAVANAKAGEVYVYNTPAGHDEVLILALGDDKENISKGTALHGAKKSSADRLKSLGFTYTMFWRRRPRRWATRK